VNREQDGPDEAAAGEADDGEHPEEAEEEEAVEGAVVDDVVVLDGKEGPNPVEPSIGQLGARVPAACLISGGDDRHAVALHMVKINLVLTLGPGAMESSSEHRRAGISDGRSRRR
jgi:hypothetical protein